MLCSYTGINTQVNGMYLRHLNSIYMQVGLKFVVEFLFKHLYFIQLHAQTDIFLSYSGAGKTTLSRFVAWMNGLSVFQIKMHNKYTGLDFDDDLRAVLRRSGCRVGDKNSCNASKVETFMKHINVSASVV